MRFAGSLRLRPVRAALLVNPRDIASIRRFLQISACLWGGTFNPIIPVFSRTPQRWLPDAGKLRGRKIARGYLDFFEPDVVIEAEVGLAEAAGWPTSNPHSLHELILPLSSFVSVDSYGRTQFPTGVNMIDVYAHLYQSEYKFRRASDDVFVAVPDTGSSGAYFDLLIGTFPNDKSLEYVRSAYYRIFSPLELPASGEGVAKLFQKSHFSPLWLTNHGFEADFPTDDDDRFIVIDPNDGQDVIDFWNARQYISNVFPININWMAEAANFMANTIERNFRPLPGNPHGVMITTMIEFGRSIGDARVNDVLATYFKDLPRGSFAYKTWPDQIWRAGPSLVRRPSYARLRAASTAIDVLVDEKNLDTSIPSLVPEFINASRRFGNASWINVLQPNSSLSDDRLAIVYPFNSTNPDFPRLRHGDPLRITGEGWAFSKQYQTVEYLKLQLGRDALHDWFKTQGVDAIPSDAGRVAEQIVRAAGSLRSCALFAERETIGLLDEMAGSLTVRKEDDGRIVERKSSERTVPVARWDQLLRKHQKSRPPWIKIERYIDTGVLRAGLEVRCPECSYRNWYDANAMADNVECARCLRKFRFPQSPSEIKATRWCYRVLGPFATPGFAGGGYAVALTLRFFAHLLRTTGRGVTWSTGLEFKLGGAEIEIDFALWYQREHLLANGERPVLMLGEAKSFAQEALKGTDIERLKGCARQFPGSFMVFSVLKPGISRAEKSRLQRLARWGRRPGEDGRPKHPVIVLTGGELFAYWNLAVQWKKRGGKAEKLTAPAYIDAADPFVLADLTQQLYLDLPSSR